MGTTLHCSALEALGTATEHASIDLVSMRATCSEGRKFGHNLAGMQQDFNAHERYLKLSESS